MVLMCTDKHEVRDCRYCEYAGCLSSEDSHVHCYLDIGEYINNPIEEAVSCVFFEYCDIFPKT